MVAISIPDAGRKRFPWDKLEGGPGSHLGALTRLGWDRYCTYFKEEVTLENDKSLATRLFFDAGIGVKWSCVFERIFLLMCVL